VHADLKEAIINASDVGDFITKITEKELRRRGNKVKLNDPATIALVDYMLNNFA
jgi:ethanolamine transporter EutH